MFSFIAGVISWKLKEKDEEPPSINSKEFKEIEKRYELRK